MLEYWIWLASRPGLREGEALKLVELYGDIRALFLAGRKDHQERGIRDTKVLDALGDKSMEQVMGILKTCHEKKIHVLTYGDDHYPERLKNISDPPLVLYYIGTLPDFDREPAIAVVGTRKATAYGCRLAHQLCMQAARCGGLIVSGAAPGIDATATLGALQGANRAVGLLGCGVDVNYPRPTRALREQLARDGCLMSEYPPGTKPTPWAFPKRNRILSGLCCGVVVVEAPERSGALITAQYALDQGRDVFAVPGSVNSEMSAGSNQLLANGAQAVRYGWDVMREYEHLFPDKVHHWAGQADLSKIFSSDFSRRRILGEFGVRDAEPAKVTAKTTKKRKAKDKTVDIREQTPYSEDDRQEPRAMPQDLSPEEAAVWQVLTREPQHADELIIRSGLGTGQALAALTLLEVKGLLTRHPGKYYTLSE